MNDHLLSIILFTPLAGMLVLLFLPSSNKTLIKLWANIAALAAFLVSIPLAIPALRRPHPWLSRLQLTLIWL